MLKIGEFSSITGISINMLRNYDKCGILVPESVDEGNGYRYYSESQVAVAHKIKLFKELGFGLKEIPKLTAFSDSEVRYMISQKIIEKQALVSQLEEQIASMKQAQENYDLYAEHRFEIKRMKLPPRKIVSMTANLRSLDGESALWNTVMNICRDNDISVALGETAYVITRSVDFVYSVYVTEVQVPLREAPEASQLKELTYYELPSQEVAAVTFDGPPEDIGQVTKYVHRYAQGIGYQVLGAPLRSHTLVDQSKQGGPVRVITKEAGKHVNSVSAKIYYYPIAPFI